MLDDRKSRSVRALVASAFAITLAATTVAISDPAMATPTPDSVRSKVQRLYHDAEVASEQLNNANTQVQSAKVTLNALNSDLVRQDEVVDRLRRQVAEIVVSQFQGRSLSTASEVVLSPDPSEFIQGLTVLDSVNNQQAEVLNTYSAELQRLSLRRTAVNAETASLTSAQSKVAEQRKKIDDAATAAQQQLSSLEAPQRTEVVQQLSGGQPQASSASPSSAPASSPQNYNVPPVSGRAAVAVAYALAQVGKPYVWGAEGPDSFDCSGLTKAAWAAAGVGLDHYTGSQYNQGVHIPASQMQPGDLVFYYSGLSHVGMYIGNDMMVNAANPSAGVRVQPVYSMPFMGAVRVGGG